MRRMKINDRDLECLSVRVGRHLAACGKTVATAESCTGGWIAKALTDIAGSSQWFVEGFVTYSNAAKSHTLGVPPALIAKHGAVSEALVRAMARAALSLSGADFAVAVSGIAGPGGALSGKPVGTVWFCWARRYGAGVGLSARVRHFRGDREVVRRKTVRLALEGLLGP